MSGTPYTASFYKTYVDESRASARVILNHFTRLFAVRSVIDVGCGIGTWLSVWQELGVDKIRGVDGEYVNASQLLIDKGLFIPHDLSRPLHLTERFELATSLEVAEHIPPKNAQTFV